MATIGRKWALFISILLLKCWENCAITNRNNRVREDESNVRHFRHIEGPSLSSHRDWEVGLRESLFQALLRSGNSDFLPHQLQLLVQSAPFLGHRGNTASPFGDIAVLGQGQLYELNGGLLLVQNSREIDCDSIHNAGWTCGGLGGRFCQVWRPRSNERLIALWNVKRLRHRISDGRYRYELEYTVCPLCSGLHEPHRFDYAIPGHVFVVRLGEVEKKSSNYGKDFYNKESYPHFKPTIDEGLNSYDKNVVFDHYPGLSTTISLNTPSISGSREIYLYKKLIESLASKTSSTGQIPPTSDLSNNLPHQKTNKPIVRPNMHGSTQPMIVSVTKPVPTTVHYFVPIGEELVTSEATSNAATMPMITTPTTTTTEDDTYFINFLFTTHESTYPTKVTVKPFLSEPTLTTTTTKKNTIMPFKTTTIKSKKTVFIKPKPLSTKYITTTLIPSSKTSKTSPLYTYKTSIHTTTSTTARPPFKTTKAYNSRSHPTTTTTVRTTLKMIDATKTTKTSLPRTETTTRSTIIPSTSKSTTLQLVPTITTTHTFSNSSIPKTDSTTSMKNIVSSSLHTEAMIALTTTIPTTFIVTSPPIEKVQVTSDMTSSRNLSQISSEPTKSYELNSTIVSLLSSTGIGTIRTDKQKESTTTIPSTSEIFSKETVNLTTSQPTTSKIIIKTTIDFTASTMSAAIDGGEVSREKEVTITTTTPKNEHTTSKEITTLAVPNITLMETKSSESLAPGSNELNKDITSETVINNQQTTVSKTLTVETVTVKMTEPITLSTEIANSTTATSAEADSTFLEGNKDTTNEMTTASTIQGIEQLTGLVTSTERSRDYNQTIQPDNITLISSMAQEVNFTAVSNKTTVFTKSTRKPAGKRPTKPTHRKTTTESNFLIENLPVRNPIVTKPTREDYDTDDIFGPNLPPPTVLEQTTKRFTESDFSLDLFDVSREPKVIWSNFYEASTTPEPTTKESYVEPSTSQHHETSISIEIKKRKRNKYIGNSTPRGVGTVKKITKNETTTESYMEMENTSSSRGTAATTENSMKVFDDLALKVLNQAKVIDYFSENRTMNQNKPKRRRRRRKYKPKVNKVNK